MPNVPNEAIVAGIAAVTKHARENASITAWNIKPNHPTPAEQEARCAAIKTICDCLDALAQRSGSDNVRFPDFQLLIAELAKQHFFPPRDYINATAEAFEAAGRLNAK